MRQAPPLTSILAAILAVIFLCMPGPARAASFEAGGLVFSDELGGFRLLGVSGSGSRDDPIVVVEEITGEAPAILLIRSLNGNPPERHLWAMPQFFSVYCEKIVINGTGRHWQAFEMELREIRDTPSNYRDGLSFGQMLGERRPLNSDRFEGWRQVDEPLDRILFFGGQVMRGEQARFSFIITDPTPVEHFFLLQEPSQVLAAAPAGAPTGAPTGVAGRKLPGGQRVAAGFDAAAACATMTAGSIITDHEEVSSC